MKICSSSLCDKVVTKVRRCGARIIGQYAGEARKCQRYTLTYSQINIGAILKVQTYKNFIPDEKDAPRSSPRKLTYIRRSQ